MRQLASFTVEIACTCPPREALRRVLDLRQHSRIIPFTSVSPALTLDELAPGAEFIARTAVGPVGFDDVMRVDELTQGADFSAARVRISKHGRAIRGTILLTVMPIRDGSLVTWHQQVRLPWLPGFLQPLAARVIRAGYQAVLRKLLALDPA
ncbi:hypothetical protein GCM10025789_15610 [Tessaracoccus lubricantis]|uniref:SRPBCC family protein n=1 Tax=Tessaracoccus lubricantis TaxID=545543 RepID=A0ABP9FBH3_9ACTN